VAGAIVPRWEGTVLPDDGSARLAGRRRFRPLTLVLGGLAVACAAGLLYVVFTIALVLYALAPPSDIPFDAAGWVAAAAGSDQTRYRMHKDLLRRHPLVGMTRSEVTALLGPPTRTNYFREWDMVYVMGPEPGFGVDNVWLVLRLADERVVEHRVVTD
jgi:hypothetical protein